MTPPNVPEFRFFLTGSSLAGKSSFVNTVSSVVSGRIKQPVIAGIPTHAVNIVIYFKLFPYVQCVFITVFIIFLHYIVSNTLMETG